MELKVEPPKAIEIAREFLKQSYTTVVFKNMRTEEKVCTIEFNVGFLNDNIKKISIDVKTGKIINCI